MTGLRRLVGWPLAGMTPMRAVPVVPEARSVRGDRWGRYACGHRTGTSPVGTPARTSPVRHPQPGSAGPRFGTPAVGIGLVGTASVGASPDGTASAGPLAGSAAERRRGLPAGITRWRRARREWVFRLPRRAWLPLFSSTITEPGSGWLCLSALCRAVGQLSAGGHVRLAAGAGVARSAGRGDRWDALLGSWAGRRGRGPVAGLCLAGRWPGGEMRQCEEM